jgi:Ca2+-binding EF-hand superfamily protein
MKKILACTFLLGWLSAMPALGQSQSGGAERDAASRKDEMARLAQRKSTERFEAADEDHNGMLSRPEVAKHFPFFDQNFARYDKNQDGLLDWQEFVGHDKWPRPAKAQ